MQGFLESIFSAERANDIPPLEQWLCEAMQSIGEESGPKICVRSRGFRGSGKRLILGGAAVCRCVVVPSNGMLRPRGHALNVPRLSGERTFDRSINAGPTHSQSTRMNGQSS